MRHLRQLTLSLALLATAAIAQQPPAPAPDTRQTTPDPQTVDHPDAVSDAQRSALTFRAYDLAVQLRPAEGAISVVAHVTVRNNSALPLPELALQISSALHWEGASERHGTRTDKLPLDQHTLQTDADETGAASEAVLRLPEPLAPNASTDLTLLYSGNIPGTGAPAPNSIPLLPDTWDKITPEATLLRGFGGVLWYPTASPQVFLGDGATFGHIVGQQLLQQLTASIRLRLSIEYTGEGPATAFFCGRQQPLAASVDDQNLPVAESRGVATAVFPVQELGFRTPSLFVTGGPAPQTDAALAVISADPDIPERLSLAAAQVLPLLNDWLGKGLPQTLTVLDHPGDPFAEADLLVAPLAAQDTAARASALLPALARSRFRSRQIWLGEGVPQFMALLWIEQKQGREAAISALDESSHALALAESTLASNPSGQNLLVTGDPVYYRNKAVAVLWAIRSVVGDNALRQTLQRYARETSIDADPGGFEKLVEQVSGKDLHWLFNDWVYNDRGLPDLSIVSVDPRQLSSRGAQGSGWLVAVEVRNEGGAAAEIPVTLSAGTLTATQRLRVGAHASASVRILFQVYPEQVQINDGTVPELVATIHRALVPPR